MASLFTKSTGAPGISGTGVDLGELIDQGVDVRVVHDNLDMETRGGRLAADIQAVIADDYIRNLREEVRIGVHGRLRQRLYPLPAPLGYRNCGGGCAKISDPIMAPLVVAAFERYATGTYTLRSLAQEFAIVGLRTASIRRFSPTAMTNLLRRRFYVGELEVAGVTYTGVDQPLVSLELFDQVHQVFGRRKPGRRRPHAFRYQRQRTWGRPSKRLHFFRTSQGRDVSLPPFSKAEAIKLYRRLSATNRKPAWLV